MADELCSDKSENLENEQYACRLLDAAPSPQNEVLKYKLLPPLAEYENYEDLKVFTERLFSLDLLEAILKLPDLL